ncbi:MAG: anti-sigma-F factor Fin [Bacillota bacterium]
MQLIYRCHECGKIIDYLETDTVDEYSLGLNILTEQEKKDIIEREEEKVYINLTCDQCDNNYEWGQLSLNQQIH